MIAVTLFLALVLGRNLGFWGYIAEHPGALGLDAAAGLGWGLLQLALVGGVVYAAVAWGEEELEIRGLTGKDHAPRRWLAATLGLGLAASLWAASLLVGMGVFILGVAGFVLFGLLSIGKIMLRRPERPRWPKLSRGEQLIVGLCAYALWHGFIQALTPQTAWDVLAYHLAIPQLYLRGLSLRELPWLLHSHAPHLLQTLFAAPLLFKLESTAALIHYLATLLLAGTTYAFGAQYLGKKRGALAAAVLLCQPVVYEYAGLAHSDAAYALFHFSACAALWRWRQTDKTAWLTAAGAFSGLACASKLFGPVLLLALAVWVRREGRTKVWRYLWPAAALAGPWYLRTWINTGNPVWPWLSGLFGGKFGAAHVDAAFVRTQAYSWASLPYDLMLQGAYFLLVPLAILLAARRTLSPPARFLLWPALCCAVFFLLVPSTGVWRYFYPLYPAFCLLLVELAHKAPAVPRLIAMVLALLAPLTASQNNQLFAALRVKSTARPEADPRELYLERSLDFYAFYQKVNARLDWKRDTILLWREVRGYHLRIPYVWGDPVNQGLILWDGEEVETPARSAERVRAELKSLEITHVLINTNTRVYTPGKSYYTSRHEAVMAEVLRTAKPVLGEGGLYLYRL